MIVAALAPSVANTKMITGTVMMVEGSCMMPSSSTASASSPAPGMPLRTKPMPISSIWMNAMPTTPCATARMVAMHSSVIFGPLSGPEMREAISSALRWPVSLCAMKTPARISAATKVTSPTSSPATVPSTTRPASLIWGANRCASPVRSVEACIQKSYRRWPTSGQPATDPDGGGMRKPPLLTMAVTLSTESAAATPSM